MLHVPLSSGLCSARLFEGLRVVGFVDAWLFVARHELGVVLVFVASLHSCALMRHLLAISPVS